MGFVDVLVHQGHQGRLRVEDPHLYLQDTPRGKSDVSFHVTEEVYPPLTVTVTFSTENVCPALESRNSMVWVPIPKARRKDHLAPWV